METGERVGRRMIILSRLSMREIYEGLMDFAMRFVNATRIPFSRGFFTPPSFSLFVAGTERQKETGEKEEEEHEVEKEVEKEEHEVEKEVEKEEAEQEVEKEENKKKKNKKNKNRRKNSQRGADNSPGLIPAEHMELVKHIQENLKEKGMKTQFTDEEVSEMLKQRNMDPDLTTQELLSLEGFEVVKSKRTKKKERADAQESKSQYEVGSSSSLKQGGSVDDGDAGRTETTHDNTIQGLQEADSNARSQLNNGSSPPAAVVSSVASQSPSSNIGKGKGKGKEIVRSTGDKTAVTSGSHVLSSRAVRQLRIHASRAGSDTRASGKNVAISSGNDSGKFPTALGSSSTRHNGDLRGERSIEGPRTHATVLMPSEQEETHTHASEARADASNPHSGSSGTLECKLLPTSNGPVHTEEFKTQHEVGSGSIVKQGGNCDDDAGRTDKTHDDTVQGLQEADSKEISQLDDVSSPLAAAVSSVASQLHRPNMGNRKGKEVVRSVDDNNAVISRSHDPPLHAVDPLRLRASSAGSDPWASRNNAATVFAHQESAGSSSTHNWNGNEFSGEKSIWGEWKVFTTPDREKLEIPQAVYDAFNNPNPGSSGTWERKLSPTSSEPSGSSEATPSTACNLPFRDPQDPVLDAPFACSRYGPIQRPGKMPEHRDMPSAQQHLHQGGGLSWANGNASGWGSFQGAGKTFYQSPQIPPYSPAPFASPQTSSVSTLHAGYQYSPYDIPWTSSGSELHPQYQYSPFKNPQTSSGSTLHDQYQYRNDYCPLPIPGPVVTAHGSFPLWALLPDNANNWCGGGGSSPQYDNQGGLRWQRPGTRVRPSHRLQSPYNRTTGNLQDPSSMQPTRDSGP